MRTKFLSPAQYFFGKSLFIMHRIYISLLACLPLLYSMPLFAHGSYDEHCSEMVAVFGFVPDSKLNDWAKFISSDMIDNHEPFYSSLKQRHPGFKCKHRLLFHWGYNSRPWSDILERRILKYCNEVGAQSPSDTLLLFQQELRAEQKRRNGLVNAKTEKTFGFDSGGTDAMYANRMASMAYNIHLLGDYMSDNSDLEGLVGISSLIGAIVTDIRTIDPGASKDIIKGITEINKSEPNEQLKADRLMAYLLIEFPKFFRQAREGSIARKLEAKGYKFRK